MLLAACHGNHTDVAVRAQPTLQGVTTTNLVWVLGASGPAPDDTTASFAAAAGRTIVLRSPGDNAIYLIMEIPPDSAARGSAATQQVTIHPVAGEYAATIGATAALPQGTRATFVFPLHFRMPPGAAAKYPSPERLAPLIVPAEVGPADRVQVLQSDHPGADMVRFPVVHPGSYELVFPK